MKQNLSKLLKCKSLISRFFIVHILLKITVVVLINLIISKQKNKTQFITYLTPKAPFINHNDAGTVDYDSNVPYNISFAQSNFSPELKRVQNYYHIYGIAYLK